MATPDRGTDQEKFEKLLAEMDWLDDPEQHMFASRFEFFKHKCKQNPAVPIGCIATITALTLGLSNFMRGGSPKRSQYFMRWRVGLQGATIGAIVTEMYYQQYKQSKET